MNRKIRDSLYNFKYLQYKKNVKSEQLDTLYVWHIHGNKISQVI